MKLGINDVNRSLFVRVKFLFNMAVWLLLQNVKGLTFSGHSIVTLGTTPQRSVKKNVSD